MMTSPSWMAPATGELACTSQGLLPLCALTRNANPPGTTVSSTLKCLALGFSGWKYQLPLVSRLIILLARSSSARASVPTARPRDRPSHIIFLFMFPPECRALLVFYSQYTGFFICEMGTQP